MKKRFNTTGVCVSRKHYMVDITNKINKIKELIDNEFYFTINRPRQFGKTTTINEIENFLKDTYLIISLSFEGLGDIIFNDERLFSKKFIELMADSIEFEDIKSANNLMILGTNVENLSDLSKVITKYIKTLDKDVLLIIDEVDKSSNNQLFLSFLGMLRNKYLLRDKGKDVTFKSVILAGVHDVKTLKIKIREGEEVKLNSPWNIAVNFKVDMSFDSDEIETMLIEYCEENNIEMDTKLLSDKLYYYTSGYPFLVSRICQIIDEDILDKSSHWDIAMIDLALKRLLRESNTLFDDLFKNMENNNDLNEFIFSIIFNGEIIQFNRDNPLIYLANLYGIIKNEKNNCMLSNRVFEQRIYNYFSSKLETKTKNIASYNFKDNFLLTNGGLDMKLVLIKFQQFMKEQYSSKDIKFLEKNGRTLFLAFLKPIINGVGFDFKEVQISQEQRLDIVVTYNNFKYIIELKLWYGQSYHEKGINQLDNYLDIHGVNDGYLIIFNFKDNKEYKTENISVNGKDIFAVYL
ncbi:AAA family ATPase [Clostridium gasigenes]|uniref:GxxExxY protein n=1 Tax=Clostridium gasigenes TaxID=94869 RepID=UPI001C0DB92E|nr:AAA family ATPase [Clostridium gasigenes]MBU3109817.1 AAA family ATPase [Clostridium gasigenes]